MLEVFLVYSQSAISELVGLTQENMLSVACMTAVSHMPELLYEFAKTYRTELQGCVWICDMFK